MARLLVAFTLMLTSVGCASSGATPSPFPRPGAAPSARPAGTSYSPVVPSALVGTALSMQGIPYRNGGADPSGFDCSGLVAYVFYQHGLVMPRTAAEQFGVGESVDPRSLQPGDLVFFSTIAPGPSHVGIVVSAAGEFVHAPSASGVVRVEPISASYWSSRFLGARRIR